MSVAEVLERLTIPVSRPERILGDHEAKFEYPEYYLVLPQIRKSLNRQVINSMKESIENGGDLGDRITSARVKDPLILQEWLDLVGAVHGIEIPFEFCEPYRHADGWSLVASGHHRHTAVSELNETNRQSDDMTAPLYRLGSDICDVSSIEEILALQKNGNNHTPLTREEAASFMVMHFMTGRDSGKWTTKAEFLRQNPTINKKSLYDAITYADLPKTIQDFVLGGELSYSLSIAVGHAYKTYADYVAVKMNDDINPDNENVFKEAVQMELGILINKILGHGTKNNKKMSVMIAKQYIEDRVREKQTFINKKRGVNLNGELDDEESNQSALLFAEEDLGLYTADEQTDMYLDGLRAEWEAALVAVRARALDDIEDHDRLMHAMVSAGASPTNRKLELVKAEVEERRSRLLGNGTLHAVAVGVG